MLTSLREGAKSAPMKIFLITLAVGFAMWGIGDVFRSVGSNDAAVKVGSYEITALEAAQEFDRTRRTYLPAANNIDAIQQGLLNEVLANIARRTVFSAEADRLGLTATRAMEKNALAQEPAFQDQNGRFNILRFRDVLAQVGLDEATYLKLLNQDLKARQIAEAIRPGLAYPKSLATEIAKWRLERRTIKYASIDINPQAEPQPQPAEIDAWYEENKETYKTPETRQVKALVLTPETVMKDITISDAELQTHYQDQFALYSTPEHRILRQIIVDDAEQAQAAIDRINNGEAFTDIAHEVAALTAEDTLLGALTQDDLPPEISAPVFAAAEGQIVGPISSALGQHIVLIVSIQPQETTEFEDIKDQIRQDLQRDQAIDLVYQRVAEIEDALAQGQTLDETALKTGAELIDIKAMDRTGLDIDGNPINASTDESIVSDTAFHQSVWAAPIGEVGLIEETATDAFYAIEVLAETPSTERPLQDIKTRIIDDMRREAAIKTARNTAKAIIDDKADLDAAAKSQGLETTTSPAMRRNGVSFDHEAARIIARKAFSIKTETKDSVETGEKIIVLSTTNIEAASGETLTDETQRIIDAMAQALDRDLNDALATSLVQIHDVTINPAPVQNLLVGQHN